ncbi:MAG: GyrI-like domain-containing protein [Bacteroidales bacterium]|jgi:effector-binding domain-containing protein|nr:GyrI-like domain-containing protein [Bacteroidales bacterium]
MAKISEIMLLQQAEQPALTIDATTDMNGMSQIIGESFMKIAAYMEECGEIPTDIPFVAYPDFESLNEKTIRMTIGFKLAKALPGKGEIKSIRLPAEKIVFCLHRGTYDELAKLYNEMMEWIKTKGYHGTGTSVEYYYTGPDVPESEHVTRVEMSLK